MHQRVAMECRVHAQYVPHELVVRLVVDDVVVGDDKCVRCERSNHRNFGEADEDYGADHLRKKKGADDRSKIDMNEAWEVDFWTHELAVSKDELQKGDR